MTTPAISSRRALIDSSFSSDVISSHDLIMSVPHAADCRAYHRGSAGRRAKNSDRDTTLEPQEIFPCPGGHAGAASGRAPRRRLQTQLRSMRLFYMTRVTYREPQEIFFIVFSWPRGHLRCGPGPDLRAATPDAALQHAPVPGRY